MGKINVNDKILIVNLRKTVKFMSKSTYKMAVFVHTYTVLITL